MDQPSTNPIEIRDNSTSKATPSASAAALNVSPQQGEGAAPAPIREPVAPPVSAPLPAPCPTCARPVQPGVAPSFVYALGRIEPRFPRLSVEKEFAQVNGHSKTAGLTDRQTLHAVLTKPENRYLVRQMAYVFTVQGLETYLLVPRDPADFQLLAEAVRPNPATDDLDAVVGVKGPIAPPEMANGLQVPILAFDKIYSFDRKSLLSQLPRPEKGGGKEFEAAAQELFDRILQVTDNMGNRDEDRALNYCAVRYPAIYAKAAEQYAHNSSLTAVEVSPSRLNGLRKILDLVFSYTNRSTDVTEKFFCRVDVTEELPFLVTKLSPYYNR